MESSVNRGVTCAFCVMSVDPWEFNDDNEVVVKLLETFGNMTADAQAAGLRATKVRAFFLSSI